MPSEWYVIGQMRQLGAEFESTTVIRSVAVCTADDAVLRPLLERHKGCEVWVYPVRHAVS